MPTRVNALLLTTDDGHQAQRENEVFRCPTPALTLAWHKKCDRAHKNENTNPSRNMRSEYNAMLAPYVFHRQGAGLQLKYEVKSCKERQQQHQTLFTEQLWKEHWLVTEYQAYTSFQF